MRLNVSDLSISRGGVKVLEGMGFTTIPGQAVIFRGPNGIGKTTLLRTLAGLQPVLGGRIEVDPENLVYSGHLDGLKAMLSVGENLAFWASVYGNRDITEAVKAFELNKLLERLAGTLSAGQKRRTSLARFPVSGRSIWIADEPTVSLDSKAANMFKRCVEQHLELGGMAIIATHVDIGLPAAIEIDLSLHKPGVEKMRKIHEV